MAIPIKGRTVSILTGLFILSASSLSLQVVLTRLFSYLFVQSYVYILISLSISGIGAGAVTARLLPGKTLSRFLAYGSFIPALLLLLLLGVNILRTSLLPSFLFTFTFYYGIGMYQVTAFKDSALPSPLLYGTDLTGAALGALSALFAMNLTGVMTSIFLTLLALTAGFVILGKIFGEAEHPRMRNWIAPFSGVLILLLLWLGNPSEHLLPNTSWEKEMTTMLQDPSGDGGIIETRWSSFGRVDMVESGNPFFKTLFIDGAAGTKMINMEGGQLRQSLAESLLFQYMGGVPLLVVEEKDRERAAVIGSGGGIDAVTLLIAGYKEIDAVEINPVFIEMVKDSGSYNGDIYNNHERIRIHQDEGRAFLSSRDESYNLILMGLPIIKSARSFSNHSLTENYLFTWQAFQEYRKALKPGGFLIVISHYPNELRKLFVNAVTSLTRSLHIDTAMATQHLAAIGNDQNPTLIMKRGVLAPSEVAGFNTILASLPVSGSVNFVPFSGTGREDAPLNSAMVALSKGSLSLDAFVKGNREHIAPVEDDSPFFYRMSRTLPTELIVVVLATLLGAIVIFILFITSRKGLAGKSKDRGKGNMLFISFGIIGAAYMIIEASVLQRFTLFWHHQTLSLSLTLAVALLASGAGSLLSSRLKRIAGFRTVLALLLAVLVGTFFSVHYLLPRFSGASNPVKMVVTFFFIFIPFFFMGFPFPTLLRLSSSIFSSTDSWPWMMGINSITSLMGGALSLIVAMSTGYKSLMLGGIGLYTLIAVLVFFFSHSKIEISLMEMNEGNNNA